MLVEPNNIAFCNFFDKSESFYYALLDATGNCYYLNSLFLRQNQIELEDAVSTPFTIFLLATDAQKMGLALANCINDPAQKFSVDVCHEIANDQHKHIHWELQMVTHTEKKMIQCIGHAIYQNATIQKEIDEEQSLIELHFSENKEAEDVLISSELFYKSIVTESLDAILLLDETGYITFATTAIEKILGYLPEEVVGTLAFNYMHPNDYMAGVTAFQDEVRNEARTTFVDIRIQSKSGEWRFCNVRSHNMLKNPYIHGIVVYFQDFTHRKQVEKALQKSEQAYREQAVILSCVNDIIVTTTTDRIINFWNKTAETELGYTQAEMLGKKWCDVLKPDYSPLATDEVVDYLAQQFIWKGELYLYSKTHEKKAYLQTISTIKDDKGMPQGFLIVAKDITERKLMESQLLKSEAFYRNLITHSLDGIIMTDSHGKIIYCGPSVLKIIGYDADALLEKKIFELIHPADLYSAVEAFSREVNNVGAFDFMLLRIRHKSGRWIWCNTRGHNLLNDPNFNSIIIYFTDDSLRKRAEDMLKESENNFRQVLNNLATGVILYDTELKVMLCNRSAYEIYGLTEAQLKSVGIFNQKEDIIREDGTIIKIAEYPVLKALASKKLVSGIIIGTPHANSKERVWVMMHADPVFDINGKVMHIVCSFNDITHQKRLAQALVDQEVQRQKMLTQATIDGQEKERKEIGKELHDNINQHITTTRLYMELAMEKTTGDGREMVSEAHRLLTDIFNEIRKLSQSLVPPTLGDIGLIESINDLLLILGRIHPFKMHFEFMDFDEEQLPENMKLMFFRIIQEQLNNIIRHAAASAVSIILSSDEKAVTVKIIDNGKGFDPSQKRKGLGLNNITNRVELFNGSVKILSAPGRGCKLILNVPLLSEED